MARKCGPTLPLHPEYSTRLCAGRFCGDTLEAIYGIPMGVVEHPGGGAPISFAR
jgi:hypothetical protein